MTGSSKNERPPPGPPNGYQRRREATRRQLLDAGKTLFVSQPAEQVSIEAITHQAGVAKGSFYNHFQSRDALFDELIEDTMQQLLDRHNRYQPQTSDPLDMALSRTRYTFFNLLSDPDACSLLLQGGQPTRGGPIDRVLRLVMGERFTEGMGQGKFRHFDRELVFAAFFGVVTQTMALLLSGDGDFDVDDAVNQVTELSFAVMGLPHRPAQPGREAGT